MLATVAAGAGLQITASVELAAVAQVEICVHGPCQEHGQRCTGPPDLDAGVAVRQQAVARVRVQHA